MEKVVKCSQCQQYFGHSEKNTKCPFCKTEYGKAAALGEGEPRPESGWEEKPSAQGGSALGGKEKKEATKTQKKIFKSWKDN